MQSEKEAIYALMSGKGKADHLPFLFSNYKAMPFPGDRYVSPDGKFEPHGTGPDAWGVLWTNVGETLFEGNMVAKGYQMFDNISDWKEHVVFPDLDHMPVKQILNGMMQGMHINREEELVGVILLSGQFERLNQMMGMENALCAFYDDPDALHEWMDAICEYKLKCIDLAWEAVHPDVICMHDDWGTNRNMFFDPELWREFIKPNEEKYAKRIHDYGMLYYHHSCGYIMQIVPDLVEIGVDVLDPVMIQNDVSYILDNFGDRITVAGGIDNQKIDAPGATEEVIRAEARRAIDAYAKKGRYLPAYVPSNPQVMGIFASEVMAYGRDAYNR